MRFLIFLLLASWAIFANAQITISEAEVSHTRTNEIQGNNYDSLYNFKIPQHGESAILEYRKRIGQRLFFYGDSTYMRKTFAKKGRGFFSEQSYKKNFKRIKSFGREKATLCDIPFEQYYKTYFTLIDVIMVHNVLIMKLKPDNADECVYFFDLYNISGGFWTIAGYLQKARKMYINKRYALISHIPNGLNNPMRFMSNNEELPPVYMGEYIYGERRSIWKCIDVTLRKPVRPEYSEENVILVLKNEDNKYEDCYIRLDEFASGTHSGTQECSYNPYTFDHNVFLGIFVPAEDFENYKNSKLDRIKIRRKELTALYGEIEALCIVNGNIKLGYTTTMCLEAWGTPIDKNISKGVWGTHEQWIYKKKGKSKYLYFENNILTAIDE